MTRAHAARAAVVWLAAWSAACGDPAGGGERPAVGDAAAVEPAADTLAAGRRDALPAGPVDRVLENRIADLAAEVDGRVGVAAVHLGTGRRAALRADERFPMASVYKLPIALHALLLVEEGALALDDSVTVTRADARPGRSFAARDPGGLPASLTLGRLLELMVGESDNTASDLVLARVGGPGAVSGRLRAMGIEGIEVSRTVAGLFEASRARARPVAAGPPDPASAGVDSTLRATVDAPPAVAPVAPTAETADLRDTTTPRAMVELLARVHAGAGLSPESHRRLLAWLTDTPADAERLGALLPPGTPIAHKTGTLRGITADVGIVTLPPGRGSVAIAVFVADSDRALTEQERVIARIARAVHDRFAEPPQRGTASSTVPASSSISPAGSTRK